MRELTAARTVTAVGAMALAYFGIQSLRNAEQLRERAVRGYEKHRWLYAVLFFGGWIAKRPRLHIGLIRLGGLTSLVMACALFLALFFLGDGAG